MKKFEVIFQPSGVRGGVLETKSILEASGKNSDRYAVLILRKWRNVGLLVVGEILAMSLWFSASSVVPQLTAECDLSGAQQSWLTMSVQIGFVTGALLSAVLNLADRIAAPRLFAASVLGGAMVNAAIPLLNCNPEITLLLRFLTGFALAGAYPPGMKLVATWCKEDRGLGIGLLVGGIVLGSAIPHLLNVIPLLDKAGMPPWRTVLLATSALAALAAIVVAFMVHAGPFLNEVIPFDWRFAGRMFTDKPTRLANFGYLGHMWELYGMWTWVPIFLIASYGAAGWSKQAARLAGFSVIAVGSIGCVMAGIFADKLGRTRVTIVSLIISGACALLAGIYLGRPGILTALCLIWGFAVVADSAQFSAAVTELTDTRYVGTALTVQTCLGFLLTLFTIRIIPSLVEMVGWERVFMILALGPVFGILSMLRLRRLPESSRMALGKR